MSLLADENYFRNPSLARAGGLFHAAQTNSRASVFSREKEEKCLAPQDNLIFIETTDSLQRFYDREKSVDLTQ